MSKIQTLNKTKPGFFSRLIFYPFMSHFSDKLY